MTTVRINNFKKVSLVALMCVIGSNHLGGLYEPILDQNGCPAKCIDTILNSLPARCLFEYVFYHYGKTVYKKSGWEYTYGISNGIVWFPKFLSLHRYFKIGLLDFSINILNIAFDAIRMLPRKFEKNSKGGNLFGMLLFGNIFINTHILSFKFFPWLKFKILSAGGILVSLVAVVLDGRPLFGVGKIKDGTVDFFILDSEDGGAHVNKFIFSFALFSPRLVLDISELIYPTKD